MASLLTNQTLIRVANLQKLIAISSIEGGAHFRKVTTTLLGNTYRQMIFDFLYGKKN